jgi:nucleoid DNA-binding protein
MTKADIVDEIAKATGLTKIETKAVVDGVFASIINAIAAGKRIELRGFGVFKHKSRKPRMARNPKTGDLVPLEQRFVPIFKPSPEFLARVNELLKDEVTEEITAN